MGYDYDRLYGETPDALGPPNAEIAAFVARMEGPLEVLDLGCGQGRDAVPLARAGHRVTGVDLSPNGIADLTAVARAEALDLTGVVADLASYQPDGAFDVVLADRTFHMLAEPLRLEVCARMAAAVRPGGWFLIVDERRNLPGLQAALPGEGAAWSAEVHQTGQLFLQRATA